MKEKIKKFILENCAATEKASFGDSESLFEKGVIDSLGFINLLSFIEKEFGVSFDPREIAMENFDSVDKIEESISRKKKQANSR